MTLKIITVTKDDFMREIYTASERQVHMHDVALKEKVRSPYVGLMLDPKDYPEGCTFLIELKTY